jgi:acyl transferase domain-containing protein
MKLVMVLRQGLIPPHLHLRTPNPHIEWGALPVRVPAAVEAWPAGVPRIGGVSSFGFSGTNAHVVVEGAAVQPGHPEAEQPAERLQQIFTLSARDDAALAAYIRSYVDFLAAHPELDLGDLSYTSHVGRSHFSHRLSVVADTAESLRRQLEQAGSNGVQQGLAEQSSPRTAFLFTGQGAQYSGMGRELYETEPVFRRTVDRCAALLAGQLESPLLEVLGYTGEVQSIDRTENTQPALFVLEYTLAQLWRSWGVEPELLLGHSVGELAAACVAGVFSLEDGLTLVAARGRLMGALPQEGEMLSLLAPESRVREAIAPYADEVSIAAINGPASVVLSGRRAAVLAVGELLAAEGVKSQRLTVSHAFHSPLMEPMLEAFRQVAERVTYHKPVLRLVSNVTGQLAGDEIATPEYWVRHVREAVRFADGVATLREQGIEVLLEIGPRPVLLGMAEGREQGGREQGGREQGSREQGGREQGAERTALLPSLRPGQSDWQQLLSSLGELYVRGAAIDWEGFDRGYSRRKVALPTYPFQRQSFWVEPAAPCSAAASQRYSREAMAQLLMKYASFTETEQETVAKVLAALEKAEKAEQLAAQVEELFYQVRWEAQPVSPASSEQGRWLVVGDAAEMGAVLTEQLTQQGEQAEVLSAAAAFSRLQDDPARWRGVLYLGGLDQPAGAANLLQGQQASLGDLLTLLQVLASRPQARTRLWVVTQQAQALSASDPVDPAQSALWGLGRVVALEHSDLWGGLVDLESRSEAAAQLLATELLAERAGEEGQVAYRRGVRHVARLVRSQPAPVSPVSIDPSASYLVTGGLGALGLQVATWLGEAGATHLVLTGRRGVTQAAQRSVLERLAASGVTVQVAELDVADEAGMRRLFAELQTSRVPLRGVFHCAGVLDDGILLNQSWERFEGVLRAKVVGGWLLHELAQELDLMVFFSSAAALLGNPGQGSYAAANAFLDGLACLRRQQGLPGLSIQWGAWAGEGMAARVGSTLHNLLPALQGELALLALEKALGASGSLAVMQVEWKALSVARRGSSFLAAFGTLSAEAPATSSLAQELAALAPNQRVKWMIPVLQQAVARCTKMNRPEQLDPEQSLLAFGLDSLMVVELRNWIIERFALEVSFTDFLGGGTILSIARMLVEQLSAEPVNVELQMRVDVDEESTNLDESHCSVLPANSDTLRVDNFQRIWNEGEL